VGNAQNIQGIITDGDLRRALLRNPDTTTLTITETMTANPVIINEDEFVSRAEQLMMERKITNVLVGSAEDRTLSGVYQIYNS
ncbi:MAG TPA: CBS domain-containing protein, partial [Mucilaginibacter sp.]